MKRREFIKKSLQAGLVAGIAYGFGGFDKIMGATSGTPDLVAVKGGTPEAMFLAGIKELGGMKAFVKKGQSVVVKPNIGWDVEPEFAANTNPGLVAEIIKSCLEAGASKVQVFDHTCDNWEDTYVTSGIAKAVKSAGGKIAPANKKEMYKKVIIPGGKTLKSALVHEIILSSDVFINVPVLKSHGTTKLTIAMKNHMGIVWDRGTWHGTGIHECIADFAAYRKPDLNIVDCYRVMTQNGPRGVNSSEDVAELKSLILSKDIVAADAAATKVFGLDPAKIKYITLAHDKGVGNMNLDKLNIKKIYI